MNKFFGFTNRITFFASFLVLLFSFQNCGTNLESRSEDGSSDGNQASMNVNLASVTPDDFKYDDMWKANSQAGNGLNFNSLQRYDFNNDGKIDRVKCQDPYTNSKSVIIYNGTSNTELYSWSPTRERTVHGSLHKRRLGKCLVFEVQPGKPAIAFINFWEIPGWRTKAPQVIIYRKKGSFVAKPVKVGSTLYEVSGRGGDCTKYPNKRLGGKQGSLCFFAGYEIGYRTHTAILKLELNSNKDLVARDLTVTGNLQPWENGIHGTPLADYHGANSTNGTPRSKKCGGSSTWDGAFMMDGAWIDYNDNGLPDLITVGQHSSVRAHRMIKDTSKAQGIRFANSSILRAGQGVIQEWLRVTALDRLDKSIKSNCVYLSGEYSGTGGCGGGMYDHLQCYENRGTTSSPDYGWTRYELPRVISAEYSPARARLHKSGDLIIKTRRSKPGTPIDMFFRVEAY